MVRLSNCLFIVLNCLSFAIGLAAVSFFAYTQLHGDRVCHQALDIPLLVTGLFLLIVSSLGFAGSCCRANLLLWIYLLTIFILILGLVGFTSFAIIVTRKPMGKRSSPNGVQDYSYWMQNYFADGRKWQEIKSCLIGAQVCKNLDNVKMKDWSLIQSGCCKPPLYCRLERKNATTWIRKEKGPARWDSDCITFRNKQAQLCYDCNSCKSGVLARIRQQWRLLAPINISVTLVLVIVFAIGCFVRSNHRHNDQSGH